MSDSAFRIKKSAVLVPVASPTLTVQGEMAYDSSDDKLKVRGASTTDPVVQEAKTQGLSNKTLTSNTIDADLNTISNIDDGNIKAGAAIDAAKIADGSVTNTEFQYLNSVTSDIQTQINTKVAGPGSSVDNTLPRFSGTTGKTIDASNIVVSDLDAVTGVTALTVDSLTLDNATISSTANPVIIAPASGFNVALSPTGGGIVDVTGTQTVTGQLNTDNLRLDGNTVSSTNTDGNIVLDPNGTGLVDVQATLNATQVNADNLRLDANTLSSTDTNGNILLDPNGTGFVSVESELRLPEIATPATPTSGYGVIYFKSDGNAYQKNDSGTESQLGGTVSFTNPTVQRFFGSGTSNTSGTYTTPANVRWLKVTVIGAGGGGGGGGQTGGTAGGAGNSSSFGTSLLTATGGSGGAVGSGTALGGDGGTANTLNSPAIAVLAVTGSFGGSGTIGGAGSFGLGGAGGVSMLGGSGRPGTNSAGQNAKTNSGAGGGGGGYGSGVTGTAAGGGGGGSGGLIVAIISSPSASYSYQAGGAGTAGTAAGAAGFAGGTGGEGCVIVEEYYQ